jgi:pimeloyl-ACP methyl ester carboxylesterase
VFLAGRKARFGGLFLLLLSFAAAAQDYEREKRWADDIQSTLMLGEAVWLQQKNGHRFLSLYIEKERSRPALIIAHGRGWSPDYELYGTLRTRLADLGYATLSIQLPVLPSTAILGLYIPLYPDARERFQLAVDFLKRKGYRDIAIVSHSLGSTMANQYLIRSEEPAVKAWVFISILQGLEEMYRIHIPVLDVFGEHDWDVTRWGADERKAEIAKVPGSAQVVVPKAKHFFEGEEDELIGVVDRFLRSVLRTSSEARRPRPSGRRRPRWRLRPRRSGRSRTARRSCSSPR